MLEDQQSTGAPGFRPDLRFPDHLLQSSIRPGALDVAAHRTNTKIDGLIGGELDAFFPRLRIEEDFL